MYKVQTNSQDNSNSNSFVKQRITVTFLYNYFKVDVYKLTKYLFE